MQLSCDMVSDVFACIPRALSGVVGSEPSWCPESRVLSFSLGAMWISQSVGLRTVLFAPNLV